MISSRKWIATASSLALVFASAVASADPGNGKGQGNGKGNPQNIQDHGKQKDQGNQGGQGKQGGQGGQGNQGYRGGPSVDRGNILGIVGGYRDYWSPGPALPPGIQKNLARGKPLPPGIAKKLDGRLLGHLPRYDGYEWQQVGTDLILVALATGLIYEIVNGAFD